MYRYPTPSIHECARGLYYWSRDITDVVAMAAIAETVVILMLLTLLYLPNPSTNSNVLGCHSAMNVPAHGMNTHEVSQVVTAIAVTLSVNSVIIFTQSTVRTPVCLDAARP